MGSISGSSSRRAARTSNHSAGAEGGVVGRRLVAKQAQPVTIPPEDFDKIAASTTKQKHLPRKWILRERRLHQATQPHKPPPHVRHARHNPDSRSRRKTDHA